MERDELISLRRQLISIHRIAAKALPQVEQLIRETQQPPKPRAAIGKRTYDTKIKRKV